MPELDNSLFLQYETLYCQELTKPMTAEEEKIIQMIYGSRARGDAHEDSDWDLLILLNKAKLEASDYNVAYPFRELGWEIGEEMNPTLYTKNQWSSWTFLPFYKNVENDKIELL